MMCIVAPVSNLWYWLYLLSKYCLACIWKHLAEVSTNCLGHWHFTGILTIPGNVQSLNDRQVAPWQPEGISNLWCSCINVIYAHFTHFKKGDSGEKLTTKNLLSEKKAISVFVVTSTSSLGFNSNISHCEQNSCILMTVRMRKWVWQFVGLSVGFQAQSEITGHNFDRL